MSVDHKATLKSEIERVKNLGGYVSQGRIFGRLLITRAFGDFELKMKQDMDMKIHKVDYVSVEPDIRYLKINFETDRFLLLASDGIFDRMSSQKVCDFVTRELDAKPKGQGKINARDIAKKLADQCIYIEQVKDNVTVILVLFQE